MALVMKSGKRLNKFYNFGVDSSAILKRKKSIISGLKWDTPLFSWPKDKESLLHIINLYLSQIELAKLDAVADEFIAKNKKKKDKPEEAATETPVESKEETTPAEDADKVSEEKTDGVDSKDEVVKEGEATQGEDKTTEESKTEGESTKEGESNEAQSSESTEEQSSTEETATYVNGETPEMSLSGEPYIPESEYIDLPEAIYDIDTCSVKVLGNIVRVLNYRAKALRKIKLMKNAGMDTDMVNIEVEKVAVYNIVLGKFLPILNKQEIVDKVNLKTANRMFEEVCTEGYQELPTQANIETEIKKNKEDQDFDIVAALAYCGVSVDKDDYGYYSVVNPNNGNGIKYFVGKSEKAFALSKQSCSKFVEEFLNKSIDKRKFITPGQVFISYISECEKSLGINTHTAVELTGLFGAMNSTKNAKQYFKDMIKKYSRNASEWKDFQKLFQSEYYANKESRDDLSSKIHIKQQAKRLVIGELFSEIINHGDILSDEQLSINDYRVSDISRDFGLNIDIDGINVKRGKIERLEDQSFRVLSTMHSILQQMRAFTQDIIDNYTVDYLRKEKIFLLQQDDQNEYISKKKEYEDLIEKLSYDKGKDSNSQIAYYRQQIDELTQKIGDKAYINAKNALLKSKNNFRILLINAKAQKENVKMAIQKAVEGAESKNQVLSIDDKLSIIKEVLSAVPELVITFQRGKATSWTKHRVGERAVKKQEPLSEVDKTIEITAARISDESHQKILEENKIREKVKKAQKDDRVKSVNAYINAYGSIIGSATGVGAYNGIIPNIPQGSEFPNPPPPTTTGPTFGLNSNSRSYPEPAPVANYTPPVAPVQPAQTAPIAQPQPASSAPFVDNGGIATPKNVVSVASAPATPVVSAPASAPAGPVVSSGSGVSAGNMGGANVSTGSMNVAGGNAMPTGNMGGSSVMGGHMTGGSMGNMSSGGFGGGYVPPMAGVMPMMPMGVMPMPGQSNSNKDYQHFDDVSEGIEPCVLPYVVGYDKNGVTTYGNMLEDYATMDRYKFLLSTNNNAIYTYVEKKKEQIQTPEQVISDLHIRYIKNAMAKSGLSTLDSNLSTFDYKGDLRKFLSQYVPQNLIDIVMSDYKELCDTVNFDLLRDLIEHRFKGDLENYIPTNIKENIVKCANMIASICKVIMSDVQIRRTYDAYSSKMKQQYITSLMSKIDAGQVPTVKLEESEVYNRMLDYLSFSIKAQNVLIQTEDAKDNGLDTYPRSIFFRQKDNADVALKKGKTLSYEQNEVITLRNEPSLNDNNDVVSLFGVLYKFNGAYNKLLLKLKPYTLNGGVKFMENILDAINEKIDLKITVLADEKDNKPKVSLVKFASKEKDKVISDEDKVFDYEDNNWFARKGFILNKVKIKEYFFLVSLGMKYALEKNKVKLKEDFYKDGMLSLPKINETFKDLPEDTISLLTSVIREIMMTKCERFIDYLDWINKQSSTHINKMLYITRVILEANNFNEKSKDEKLETIESLEYDFTSKADDIFTPHPEIYSTTEEIEHYTKLYLYYALSDLFEKMPGDERFITPQLTDYFEDMKRKFRNELLAKIRDRISLNGYEQDMARYFELNLENAVELEGGIHEVEEEEDNAYVAKVKLQNIDVIFKGILDGYNKAIKGEDSPYVLEQMEEVGEVLNIVGSLPNSRNEEKDLEIALPNNQTILCNVKGFLQQYLFRFIVDKEHELGPFAYVVSELAEHEELSDRVKNIEIVANKLNANELGINLIAQFSTINMTNAGNVLNIGESISTVVETINRFKTPTDQQKALNRDVFYKEGVAGVAELFTQYFSRLKLEQME